MRYVVECEIYSEAGESLKTILAAALSTVGAVEQLKVEPMPSYALTVRIGVNDSRGSVTSSFA